MKNHYLSLLVLLFQISFLSICFFGSSFSQVQGVSTVSATTSVAAEIEGSDPTPPTNPILISPNNNAYVNISRPTFVWREATDDSGISHYVMSLDGSTYFSNIPTTPTENDDYVLTYNPINGQYSLTVKENIADGTHTWMIRAVNTGGLGTNSATWNFTIDTQAPAFVLIQVGEVSTSISAQDPTTVPLEPIQLTENEPLLVGNGEAGATVDFTIIIPGDPNQTNTQVISPTGTWGLQLGTLPRNVIMTLDFIITDPAGHISLLQGVQIIILGDVIVIPPISPGVSPGPSGLGPILELTVVPGDEIIKEIIQEVGEVITETLGPPLTPIAEFTTVVGGDFLQLVGNALIDVLPLAPLLLTVAATILTTISTTGGFSAKLIGKTLQSLGILPAGKPQGLVYDSDTQEPVAFALLTITNAQKSDDSIQETVVTDVNGVYSGVKLQPNSYMIDVRHQEYHFPTGKTRPAYLTMRDFYKGEPFSVKTKRAEQLFLIPLDSIKEKVARSLKYWFKLALLRFNSHIDDFLVVLFIFSGLMVAFYPTIWNWLVLGTYGFLLAKKLVGWLKVPNFSGSVIDLAGQPLANVVLRLSHPETGLLESLVTTNQAGIFEAFVDKDIYQLSVIKTGYIWEHDASLSMFQVDLSGGSLEMVVKLQPAGSVLGDFLQV